MKVLFKDRYRREMKNALISGSDWTCKGVTLSIVDIIEILEGLACTINYDVMESMGNEYFFDFLYEEVKFCFSVEFYNGGMMFYKEG